MDTHFKRFDSSGKEGMKISIRTVSEIDWRETENLTREAFWDLFKPGCDEHLVLHQLRQSAAYVPELDVVACEGGRIVGHIIYTKAVVRDGASESAVLCMGPLSVLPELQRQGIGELLMRATIEKARELSFSAVVIFGHPGYYQRFGFREAGRYDIQTSAGENLEPFMALDLQGTGLPDAKGRFFEDEAFQVKPEELEAFEKNFPPREKHKLPGQFK